MTDDGRASWWRMRRRDTSARALVIVAGALALMSVVAVDLITRQHRDAGQATAQVITASIAHSRIR